MFFTGGGGSGTPYQAIFSQSVDKTDEDVITLPISLYAPALVNTTVTLTPGGTARPSTEDYGTGKNYTLSATSCTILAGATTPATPVTLTVVNNPIYDVDRVASISLSDSHGYALSYATLNITILDNGANRVYANVKTGYGGHQLAGDGVTNDGPALLALLVDLYAALPTDGNGLMYAGVLEFPAGTYIIGAEITLQPGVTLVSTTGAILKRSAGTYNSGQLFKTVQWASVHDSHPLVLKGIELDGSCPVNVNAVEHTQLLYGIGGATDDSTGKMLLYTDNITAHDAIGYGLYITGYTNYKSYNDYTYNNHQFGLCPTYMGASVLDIRKHKDRNAITNTYGWGGGLHLEGTQDGITITYNDCDYDNPYTGSYADGTSTMSGATFLTADTVNATVTANNIIATGVLWFGGGQNSVQNFNNCAFNHVEGYYGRIQVPGIMTFKDSSFKAVNPGATGEPTDGFRRAVPQVHMLTGDYHQNQVLTFDTCVFLAETMTEIPIAIDGGAQTLTDSNSIITTGCTWQSTLNQAEMSRGGIHQHTDPVINSVNAFNIGHDSTYTGQTTITRGIYTNTGYYLFWYDYAGSTLTNTSVALAQAQNILGGGPFTTGTFSGSRAITGVGGSNPNTIHAAGLTGDTYTNGTATWECTTPGITTAVWTLL